MNWARATAASLGEDGHVRRTSSGSRTRPRPHHDPLAHTGLGLNLLEGLHDIFHGQAGLVHRSRSTWTRPCRPISRTCPRACFRASRSRTRLSSKFSTFLLCSEKPFHARDLQERRPGIGQDLTRFPAKRPWDRSLSTSCAAFFCSQGPWPPSRPPARPCARPRPSPARPAPRRARPWPGPGSETGSGVLRAHVLGCALIWRRTLDHGGAGTGHKFDFGNAHRGRIALVRTPRSGSRAEGSRLDTRATHVPDRRRSRPNHCPCPLPRSCRRSGQDKVQDLFAAQPRTGLP